MNQHIGKQSILFETPPVIRSTAAIGGKKEIEGPLASHFDILNSDTKFGQESWEKAESTMQKLALQTALEKTELKESNLDVVFAGDRGLAGGYNSNILKLALSEMEGKEVVSVSGNTCKNGEKYAKKELTNPTRIVTSTVRVAGGTLGMVSVKTSADIPKGKIFDCVKELQAIGTHAAILGKALYTGKLDLARAVQLVQKEVRA